nr:hypothetical protein OH820_27890 [Streptomyces sp. NBC_00857]
MIRQPIDGGRGRSAGCPHADDFPSLAHQAKSIIGGPTAKSFSTVFAAAYDRIAEQRVAPSNLYAAEPDAKVITEQLIRDADYDPLFIGDLTPGARLLEDSSGLTRALGRPDRPLLLPLRAPRAAVIRRWSRRPTRAHRFARTHRTHRTRPEVDP